MSDWWEHPEKSLVVRADGRVEYAPPDDWALKRAAGKADSADPMYAGTPQPEPIRRCGLCNAPATVRLVSATKRPKWRCTACWAREEGAA